MTQQIKTGETSNSTLTRPTNYLFVTSKPARKKLLSKIITNTQGLTNQEVEDDGLTITTNVLGEVTMSNNAATQAMSEEMATLNREVAAMRAVFAPTHKEP